MPLITAYIDTNILIDYCWFTFFSEGSAKKSKAVILVDKGAQGLFDMHISFYTLVELSNHFRHYYLEQKAIKHGYSYPDCITKRASFELSESERKTISELVEKLRNSEYLTYIEIEKMHEKFFPVIKKYLEGYIEFVDAYHLRIAIEVGCDYIVTRDSGFRKRVQALITDGVITEPIKITSPSGFLEIVRTNK